MEYKSKDIAKIIGVSPATVSMVLNNKPGISDEKRTMIINKIKELGCTQLLKSNVSNEQKFLGFAVFKRGGEIVGEHPFFSFILENIDNKARQNGYSIVFLNLDNTMDENTIFNLVKNAHCEGLIIFATEMEVEDLNLMSKIKIPIVYLDNSFLMQNIDTITINNPQGITIAMNHLINQGHKHIGYLKSKVRINSFRERYDVYKSTLAINGLEYNEDFTFDISYGMLDGYRDMCSYIASGIPFPTAFISDNDIIAVSAIEGFQSRKFRIPDDFSIIGFDDRPNCLSIDPNLSTIKVHRSSFADLSLDLILSKISYNRDYSLNIKVGTELILRNSTKSIL